MFSANSLFRAAGSSRPWIILDIDGCLADDSRRMRKRNSILDDGGSQAESLAEYNRPVTDGANDDPALHKETVQMLARHFNIAFITGRISSARMRMATKDWLCRNYGEKILVDSGGRATRLYLRPTMETSPEFKPRIVRRLKEAGGFILGLFDDRNDVLDAYRNDAFINNAAAPPFIIRLTAYEETQQNILDFAEQLCSAYSAHRESWNSREGKFNDHEHAAPINCRCTTAPINCRCTTAPITESKAGPAKALEDAAALFAERGATYGEAYNVFGDLCAVLWPEGLRVEGVEQFRRLGVFVQILTKVMRYANNMETGHLDSARDLIVYAAILQDLTEEEK